MTLKKKVVEGKISRKGKEILRNKTMMMKKSRNIPPISIRILNFLKSLFNHIRTGMKKSSQKEIYRRYDICKLCPYFEPLNSDSQIKAICQICGCNLSDTKIVMNKLAWKDQKCPLNRW